MTTMQFNAILYIIGFFAILLAILWITWSEHRLEEKEQARRAELDRMERARRHRAIRDAIRQQELDQLNPHLFDDRERDAK